MSFSLGKVDCQVSAGRFGPRINAETSIPMEGLKNLHIYSGVMAPSCSFYVDLHYEEEVICYVILGDTDHGQALVQRARSAGINVRGEERFCKVE